MTVAALTPLRSRLRWPAAFDSEITIGVIGGSLLAIGMAFSQPVMIGAGAVGVCMVCRNLIQRTNQFREAVASTYEAARQRNASPPGDAPEPERHEEPNHAPPPEPRRIDSEVDLVDAMLVNRRYALLLRPETASQLERDQYLRAIRELDDAMVLTPAGSVLLGVAAERETLGHDATAGLAEPGAEGVARVEPCYVDRYTVTNADFQHFVDGGGYEELEFWPEVALPALFDFIDQTGVTAPRFWREGHYAEGKGKLPVVGVSWYEAVAYARWVGKRLPNDAEWTKTCAWPIESAPGRVAQRRYPWGEAFDTRRANLWSAGHARAVEVDAYPDGAAVGGVEQMVGNVWEWTSSTLDETTPQAVRFPSALRTIRGGAYNTYFENQATCHFQSAEHPLARKANIGIRLAISMDTLASATASQGVDE